MQHFDHPFHQARSEMIHLIFLNKLLNIYDGKKKGIQRLLVKFPTKYDVWATVKNTDDNHEDRVDKNAHIGSDNEDDETNGTQENSYK